MPTPTEAYEYERMARLLAASAYLLYRSCDVGNPAPSVRRRLMQIVSPRPGDLVLEISALGAKRDPALGRLVGRGELPIGGEWDEEVEKRPRPLEEFWFIETLHGELQKWNDCRFIRVFEDWSVERTDSEPDMIPVVPGSYTMDRVAWVRDARARHGLLELLGKVLS